MKRLHVVSVLSLGVCVVASVVAAVVSAVRAARARTLSRRLWLINASLWSVAAGLVAALASFRIAVHAVTTNGDVAQSKFDLDDFVEKLTESPYGD